MRLRAVLLFLVASAAMQPAGAGAQPAPAQALKEAAPQTTIVYRNNVYGFCVVLPESWKGYTILTSEWEGRKGDGSASPGGTPALQGPLLRIRHPSWTNEDPREDIPIMIFTRVQWRKLYKDNILVSPAAVGPSELSRNHQYVFALPARYDNGELAGWQEVESLMQHHALQTPCGKPAVLPGRNIP
jgi:hypothetical protein